jgi:hypothetical protein
MFPSGSLNHATFAPALHTSAKTDSIDTSPSYNTEFRIGRCSRQTISQTQTNLSQLLANFRFRKADNMSAWQRAPRERGSVN